MRLERANPDQAKGWYAGPWNSALPISLGYANVGLDEPHVHSRIAEIYLVARGTAVIRIEQESIPLSPGDMLVVEAGEAHTFLESSPDYFHFVIHAPGLAGDEARTEKAVVAQSRLGLAEQ